MLNLPINILLIEEDSVNNSMQQLLSVEAGLVQFHITRVATFTQAFDSGLYQDCHLVVYRLQARDYSANENITMLLQKAPHLPVVVLVDAGQEDRGRAAQKVGARSYLVAAGLTREVAARVFLHAIECQSYMNTINTQEQHILQSIIDALPQNVAIISGEGNILAVNRAWQAF